MSRRFAFIQSADIVDYSLMMAQDESATIALVHELRDRLLEPIVERYEGEVLKRMGDGWIIAYPSVASSVLAALEIQNGLAEHPKTRLRMGIHMGDIVHDEADLYGAGVNIACRLQTEAPPGGVLISADVYNQLSAKQTQGFWDAGTFKLKNIPRPIQCFQWRPENLFVGNRSDEVPAIGAEKRANTGPKILVLPFNNTSNDPDQEYFSDGITEDVITDLSKVAALSVIARNTAFTFKGRAIDVAEIAQRMNLTHVVEGSVRKSGSRIRINAQLVDGATGHPIWADRFDRDLIDIFDLQDEITQAIVAGLRVRLVSSEREAIQSRPTDNPAAYEIYLQARYHHTRLDRQNYAIAARLAQQALEIDPNYDRAWAQLAISQTGLYGLSASAEHGLEAAERALALNPDLAEALAAKAFVLAGLGRFDEAFVLHERSLELDPESYDVRFLYGRSCFQTGRHHDAIMHWERAAELSETALPAIGSLSMCYTATGQHEKALDAARRTVKRAEHALSENSSDSYALMTGGGALAKLGEAERAKQWSLRAKAVDPEDLSIDFNIACVMATLGEAETALDRLETCLPRVDPVTFSVWVKQDPDLDSLRDIPRFQRLIRDLDARAADANTLPAD